MTGNLILHNYVEPFTSILPLFLVLFLQICLMYICVSPLEYIYFNMKDSGHFDKCNFHFLYLRKSGVLLFIWLSLQIY